MELTGLFLELPRTLLLLAILFCSLQAQTCNNLTPLDLANPDVIPNSQIVTSSEAEGHGKEQIGLNCCEDSYGNAWCPDPKDKQPYVEIRFDRPVPIGQIDIQPPSVVETDPQYPINYMKTFDLLIKLVGINGLVRVAQNVSAIANETVSINSILLNPTVYTDVVRIEPRDSEKWPCFRMELYQCETASLCPLNYCQNNGTCSQPDACDCPDSYYGEMCQYSKETIPLTVYKFLQISGNTIVTATHNLTFSGGVSLEDNNVLVLQPGGYLTLADISQGPCFSNLDTCLSGFTINLEFRVSKIDTNSLVVLTNGGADDPRIKGTTLHFQHGNLYCYVSTSEKVWAVIKQFTLTEATWYKLAISWSVNLGLLVLQDRELIGSTFTSQSLDNPATRAGPLILGYNEETSTSVLHFREVTMVPLDWPEFQRAELVTAHEDTFADRSWDLRDISQLVIESHNWFLTLKGRPAFGEDGVTITRIDQHLEISNLGNSCLTEPGLCKDGLTLKISIKLATIEEDSVIFTTGGEYKNHPGIALLYRYEQFHAIVSTESFSWFVSVPRKTILTSDFCDIILSWSQHTSLKLIINQVLVGESASPIPHPDTTLPDIDRLTIGNGIIECVISELHIWQSHIEHLNERGSILCVPCSKPPTSLTTTEPQSTQPAQSTRQTTPEAPRFTDSTTDGTYDYYDECPVGCVPSYICFEEPTTAAPEPTPSCDLTSPPTTVADATTKQKTSFSTTVTKSTPQPSSPPSAVTHSTSQGLPSTNRESTIVTSTPAATTKPPCPLPTACPNLTTNRPPSPPTTAAASTTPQLQSTSSAPDKSTTHPLPISLTTEKPTTPKCTSSASCPTSPTSSPSSPLTITVTNTTAPQTTASQTTAPQTTASQTTVSQTTPPQTTGQQTTKPQTTGPQTTAPETTVPSTVRDSTIPQTSRPPIVTDSTTQQPPLSSSTTEKPTTPRCTSSSSCPTSATSSSSPRPTTTVTDTTAPQTTAPQTTVSQTTGQQTTGQQTPLPSTVRDSTIPQTSRPPIVTDSTTQQPPLSSSTTEKPTTPRCTSSSSCPTAATSNSSPRPTTTVTDTTAPQTTATQPTVSQTTAPQTTAPQTTAQQTTAPQTTVPPTVRDSTTPQTSRPPIVTDSTQQPTLTSTTEKPTTPKCTSSSSCPTSATSNPTTPPPTTVTETTAPQTTSQPTKARDSTTPQTSQPSTVRDSTTPQPPSSSTTEKPTTPKCTSSSSCPTSATSNPTTPPPTTVTETTAPQTTSQPTKARDSTTPQISQPSTVTDSTTPQPPSSSTTEKPTTPKCTSSSSCPTSATSNPTPPPTTVTETTAPQTTSQPTKARDSTTPQTSQPSTVTDSTTPQPPSSSTTEKPTTTKCTSSSSCPTSATSNPTTPPPTTVTETTAPQTTSQPTKARDSTTPQTSQPSTVRDSTTPQPPSSTTTEKPTTPKCTSSSSCPTSATSNPTTPPPTTVTETTAPQTTSQPTKARDSTTPQTSQPSTVTDSTTPQPPSSSTTEKSTTTKCTSSSSCPTSATSNPTTPPPTTVTETTAPQTTSQPTKARDSTTPQTSQPSTVTDSTTPQPPSSSTTEKPTTTKCTSSSSCPTSATSNPTTPPPTTVTETTAPQTTSQPTKARDSTTPQTSQPSTVRDSTTPQPPSSSTTEKSTTTKCTSSSSCPTSATSNPTTPPPTTVTETTAPQTTSQPTKARDSTTSQPSTVTDSTTPQPPSSSTTEKSTTTKCTSSSSCPTSATSNPTTPPPTTVTETTAPQTTSQPTKARDSTTPQTSQPSTVTDSTTPQPPSSSTTEKSTTTKCTSSSSCPTSATSNPSTTSVTNTTPPPPTTVTDSTPQPSSPTTRTTTTTTSTSATTKPPCPPPPSSVTLVPEVNSSGQGHLTCSVAVAPELGIRIKFTWTIEGSSSQWSKEIEAPDRSASISVTEINVSILNKAITCTAEVRYSAPNAEWCWPERSNVVVPSVKCPPVNGTIKVVEGQEEQFLQVQVTVPPSLLCRPEDNGQCRVEVSTTITTVSNELKCSVKEIIPQAVLGVSTVGQGGELSCGVAITSVNWKDAVTIPIKATLDGVTDGDRTRKLKITVRIIGQITLSPDVVETCGEIDIIVVDRDKGATCSSVNDPHMKSFDEFRFNNFIIGEFIMYKHRYLEYEVRALYSACDPKRPKGATCNCGAAVRSGDDVITFDTCKTRQNQIKTGGNSVITVDMYKNGELTPGTRVIRHGCGQKYEVILPTRTTVVITSSVKPFMNINIQASAYDFESTEGLCGDFNGNRLDDLGGQRNIDEFNKQWLRNVTIFKGVPALTTPARPTFCSCQSGQQPVCQPGLDVYICNTGTTSANDITAALVSQAKTPVVFSKVRTLVNQVQSRGRRAVDTTSPQNTAVFDDETGFTEDFALQYCQDYIENSSVIQLCQNHLKYDAVNESIRNCVEDLMGQNDTQWAASQVDDMVVECLADVQTNVTTWENNENDDGPNIPVYISTSLCTHNCSEHGSCVNSICDCQSGWTGDTCQIGSTTTPTVLPALETCDLMTSSCSEILVEGNNFVSTDKLTCRIRYITIDGKVSVTAEEYTVQANLINLIQVVCPENIASSSSQSRSALVAVSNDGVTYSDNTHIHVIQKSTCQTCTLSDDINSVSCSWKPGSCVIDNQCYTRFETFGANACYRCDPDVSLDKWTKISDPNCTFAEPEVGAGAAAASTSDNTATIVLGVVCGVLALVTVAVTIVIVRSRMRKSAQFQGLWEGEGNFDIYHRRPIQSSADVSGQSDAARINAFYNPALSSSTDLKTN